jgi:hypothetical protein
MVRRGFKCVDVECGRIAWKFVRGVVIERTAFGGEDGRVCFLCCIVVTSQTLSE